MSFLNEETQRVLRDVRDSVLKEFENFRRFCLINDLQNGVDQSFDIWSRDLYNAVEKIICDARDRGPEKPPDTTSLERVAFHMCYSYGECLCMPGDCVPDVNSWFGMVAKRLSSSSGRTIEELDEFLTPKESHE